jgi:hypothetical protein
MKIRQFINNNIGYVILILFLMLIASIYFAAVDDSHPILFLICFSPFIVFILFLNITALMGLSSIIINYFSKLFGSKITGIISLIVFYVIITLIFVYSI